MKKNKILLIVGIVLAIIIILIFFIKNKNNNIIPENLKNTTSTNSMKINYNEKNNVYEIIDEATGEIIVTTENEDDIKMQFEFYKRYPNYRENPPISPNAEDDVEQNIDFNEDN